MITTRRSFLQLICGALGVGVARKVAANPETHPLPILNGDGMVSESGGKRYSSTISADGKMRIWNVYDRRGVIVSQAYCPVAAARILTIGRGEVSSSNSPAAMRMINHFKPTSESRSCEKQGGYPHQGISCS